MRIVGCIRDTVTWATYAFLMPFSVAMSHIVQLLSTLAVMAYGFNVLFVRQQRLKTDAYILAIKLGAVMMFSWNFGGAYPLILDSVDWMVNTVSAYIVYSLPLSCPFSFSIWERVDCALDRLVGGILPGSALSAGFLGFLFGSIFSGATGFAIFLMGLSFVVTILMAIFKAVYIYLSSFIAVSMLVIISPMIIPLILFRNTKAYFEKWLRLLMGVMLQPLFLFAYLSMLLAAFDVVIYSGPKSLYATIAGQEAYVPNFRIGNWMIAKGAYVERSELDLSINLNSREMAEGMGLPGINQTGMWGEVGKWSDGLARKHETMINKNIAADVPVQAVDFPRLSRIRVCPGAGLTHAAQEACYTQYIVRVAMALLMAAVVAYIFYLMLQFVPYLGTLLSGEIMSTPELGKGMFDKGMKDFQHGMAPKPAAMPGGGQEMAPRREAAPPRPVKGED